MLSRGERTSVERRLLRLVSHECLVTRTARLTNATRVISFNGRCNAGALPAPKFIALARSLFSDRSIDSRYATVRPILYGNNGTSGRVCKYSST